MDAKEVLFIFFLEGKKKRVSEKLYILVMFSFIFPNCGLPCIVQCLFLGIRKRALRNNLMKGMRC